MKKRLKVCLTLFAFISIVACYPKEANVNGVTTEDYSLQQEISEKEKESNIEDVNMGLSRMNLTGVKQAGKKEATKEFFENLDRDANRDYIVEEVGMPDAIAGSGIGYDIWDVEEGVSAWICFSKPDQKIESITIVDSEGKGETIYQR